MASHVVFGCLKHRTLSTDIHICPDKVLWVDLCGNNTDSIRVHTTELEEDLLNRRSIVSTLDTKSIPLCQYASNKESETTTSAEESGKKRRCTGDPIVDSNNSHAKKARQEADDYFQLHGLTKRIATGRLPYSFTDSENKNVYVTSLTPGVRSRYPAGQRSVNRPDRLICKE